MERGKPYVFLNSKKEWMAGKYLGQNEEGIMAFHVEDNERSAWFSKEIHDELNPGNNVNHFIEYIAEKFQNKFHNNTSVIHEDYEFKVSIPRYYPDMVISLNGIEEIMNDVLEDWWSVQWSELKYNKIQCKRDSVEVSFRVHDIHEVQFRYNEKN